VDDGLIGVAMTMADVIDAEVSARDRSAFVILTGCAKLVPVLLQLRGDVADDGSAGADVELAALAAAFRDAPGP
jgi:hypothetical protein